MHRRALPLVLAVFLFTAALSTAQTVNFNRSTYGFNESGVADLNNDGREDIIGPVGVDTPQFTVALSNGDGTYAPPTTYTMPAGYFGYFAVGDFNGDGWADIIVSGGTNGLYEFLNNGDGTFHLQATFTVPSGTSAGNIVSADFNHDGKIDIAWIGATNNGAIANVWFSNGDGGFTVGPSTPVSYAGFMFVGDFDGDGKADLLVEDHNYGTGLEVLYGDGTGHFPVTATPTEPGQGGSAQMVVADVNGDGRSDIIGGPMYFSTNGSIFYKRLDVLYGNADRTFTGATIATNGCVTPQAPTVADFNGDGRPDLAVLEYADCNGSEPESVNIMLRNADGSYQPEQALYTNASGTNLQALRVLRTDRDTKADLGVTQFQSTGSTSSFVLFQNTTSGSFPGCDAPNAFTGINVCSPGSSVSSTTVPFSIGASGQSLMRKVEVWVDGTKMKEQLTGAFSHTAYLDANLTLTTGSHNVTIYAAGWDNWLESKSFTFTVGSSASSSCPPPASPGVNVCSPQAGSTVTSPVQILATGKNTSTATGWMDVWMDGTKVGTATGPTANYTVSLANGSHQLDIYAIGTNGEKIKSTTLFSVGSSTSGGGGGGTSGSCPPPSTASAANVCSPLNGSTVASPVSFIVQGGASVTYMEGWLDGVKIVYVSGAAGTVSYDVSKSVAAGSHQFDVYARVGSTTTFHQTIMFNVSSTTSGGGGSCPPPSTSSAANYCSPLNGSTVSSPVTFWAVGGSSVTYMEGWLDGVKFVYVSGPAGTVSYSVNKPVASGSHKWDIYARVGSTTTYHQTVYFTVQ